MVLHSFHLFAGAGGGILADLLLGHIPIGAIEINQYCRETLLARQADLVLPRFPIWDDVNTFRSDNPACSLFIEKLVGMSEELIISGGFPCQDISVAGKGAGITGERSGLWKEMFRIIREVRPRFAFVENVPALVSRGLDTVLGDLASIGYDAEWCVLGADDVGAPHHRKRIWILAYSRHLRGRSKEQGAIRESEENELQCDTITGSSETRDASDSKRDDLWHESGRISRKEGENQAVTRNDGENWNIPDSTSERLQERGLHIRHGRPFETETDALGNCENVSDTLSEHDYGTGHGTGEICRESSQKTEVLGNIADTDSGGFETERTSLSIQKEHEALECGSWWKTESGMGRVVDGMANRVDRIRALGNGQVAIVAATAWSILMNRLNEKGE